MYTPREACQPIKLATCLEDLRTACCTLPETKWDTVLRQPLRAVMQGPIEPKDARYSVVNTWDSTEHQPIIA